MLGQRMETQRGGQVGVILDAAETPFDALGLSLTQPQTVESLSDAGRGGVLRLEDPDHQQGQALEAGDAESSPEMDLQLLTHLMVYLDGWHGTSEVAGE